jgi:hypothetical protein
MEMNKPTDEGGADSIALFGSDDERPRSSSKSSNGSSLSPAPSSLNKVKSGESSEVRSVSTSSISRSDVNVHNEVDSQNQELVAPGGISVYDYMVPHFADEDITQINGISEEMNPFAYQDYNDAWESVVSI